MPLGPADDGLDAGLQFFAVEGLGHIVVCPETKAAQLAFCIVRACQDQDRRIDARKAQVTQNLHPVHVGQVQIQQDQVIVIKLGQIDAFLAHVGQEHVVAGRRQHQFDRTCRAGIVFYQKNAHG